MSDRATRRDTRPTRHALAAAFTAGACVLAPPAPASSAAQTDTTGQPGPASTSAPPAWEVALTDATTEARAGTATYHVTIRNRGRAAGKNILIRLTAPTQITFAKADKQASVQPHEVAWTLNLAAAATATLHATGKVGPLPGAGQRGIAVSACAFQYRGKVPVVCAADINQIPGAPSIHQASSGTVHAPGTPVWSRWWMWLTAAGALALALGGVGALLVGRRVRSRRTQHRPATTPAGPSPADAAHAPTDIGRPDPVGVNRLAESGNRDPLASDTPDGVR